MKDPNLLYPDIEQFNPESIYTDEMKQSIEKYIPEKKKIRPGSSVDYMKPTVSYDI